MNQCCIVKPLNKLILIAMCTFGLTMVGHSDDTTAMPGLTLGSRLALMHRLGERQSRKTAMMMGRILTTLSKWKRQRRRRQRQESRHSWPA